MRLRNAPSDPAAGDVDINRLDVLRPILWMASLAIIVCLLAGYIALANLIALVTLLTLFTVSVTYVLVVLVGAGLG